MLPRRHQARALSFLLKIRKNEVSDSASWWAPMIDIWYYADKKQPVGPFSLADLKADIQKIPNWKDLLVWRDGFTDWQKAESVNEILALFVTPPPIPTYSASKFLKPEPKKSSNWSVVRILLGIAVLAAVVVSGAFWQIIVKGVHDFLTPPSLTTVAVDIEKGLADASVKMRAGLPKKIDATTTLTSVKYEGTKLIYENRIAMDGAKFDDAMKDKLRQSVTKNVCTMAETRRVLDLGGSFLYVYEDIEAKPVMTIDIAKHNCS
jgi:hypothetical protein